MIKSVLSVTLFFSTIMFIDTYVSGQSTIIGWDTTFSYFAAQEEPSADWFMPKFDDSGWPVDTHTIGFGTDFQYVTISPETKSLYLRYKFTLNNPQNIRKLSYLGDYDDGYITYLNGKEILRVNVPDSVKFPAYNDITSRSHEMEYFTSYPVYGYYLDTMILDTCLVEGENVVAVHILNDSLNGSDLCSFLRLYNLTNATYNIYSIAFRFKRQYFVDSVNFPLVMIETDGYGIPYKNERVNAFMGIVDNGPGAYNKPTDSCNVYYGDISIEVRGQSSSEFPKRSYRFELKDSLENDSNVVLLGMPSNDDWILYGPFQDKAQFRNPMVFDLARRFGRYQPRTRYCEVMLNGESVGLYTLTESIKRGGNRIDIARLSPEETEGVDITGGYIMKYDKPAGRLEIVYPKPDVIVPEQRDYINGYLAEYRATLFTDYFMDPDAGFRRYIDATSLADYMIMIEFPKNCDGYMFSTYLYKDRADRNNKIIYGPVWDNDLSFGNTSFQDGASTDGWHFEHPYDHTNIYMLRMLQDTAFVHLLQARWAMARNSFLHADSIMDYIDSTVSLLAEPIARNYYVWPLIDLDIWHSNYVSVSYEDEINNIKSWIMDRLEWIDNNIGELYYEIDYYPNQIPEITREHFGFEVFPNPFSDKLTITFSSSDNIEIQMNIYDISGQLKYAERDLIEEGLSQIQVENSHIQQLVPGIYILRITSDNGFVATRKLVKH